MRKLIGSFFILCIVIGSSCKTSKQISEAMTKVDTALVVLDPSRTDSARMVHDCLAKIDSNKINFQTLRARIRFEYTKGDNKLPELTAYIQIRKDSVIWVSINALGIEQMRVLITPDSVKVMDKREKTVSLRSMEYLQEVAELPFDFHTLQSLLVGNPVYMNSRVVSYRETEQAVSLLVDGDFFRHLATFSKPEILLQTSKLDDVNLSRARTGALVYGNYEMQGARKFSMSRRITIVEKNKLDIILDFKQVEFDTPLNYVFQVPKNYTIR